MSDNMIAMFGTTAFFIALLLWVPLIEGTCSLCRKLSTALRGLPSAKTTGSMASGEIVDSPQKQL